MENEEMLDIVEDVNKWLRNELGEYPDNYGLGFFDAEDRKNEGWSNGNFDGNIAAMKIYRDIEVPLPIKMVWRARGAPEEDVNKKGVMLVRFSGEWGYSKIYVYPLGCLDRFGEDFLDNEKEEKKQ